MNNIVFVNFECNEITKVVAQKIWQYDYGQILRIQGLNLPAAVEIHFSLQKTGGIAERRIGVTRDGVTDVVIPDFILKGEGIERNYSAYVFIYLSDEESGQTEHRIELNITSRPEPEGSSKEEDTSFGAIMDAVNKIAEQNGQGVSDEKIAEAVNAYMEANPVEGTADVVQYISQNLTDEQQTQARANISAASAEEVSQLQEQKVDLPKDANGNLLTPTEGQTLLFRADGTTYYGTPTTSGGGDNGDTGTTVHGIVWDLVNVTSSNNLVSIADGQSLVAVLTPLDGYALGDVTVTMGGEVLTGVWNADTFTVTIASVTGDVIVSCSGMELQEVTENLKNVAGYHGSIGTFPTTTDNEDGETYTADWTGIKYIDASLGTNGDYYISYFGQEVTGGVVNIEFDTTLFTKLEMKMMFVDTPIAPVFGTATDYHVDKYISANGFTGTEGELGFTSLGTGCGSVILTGSASIDVPDGYYPIVLFRRMHSAVVDETINSNALFSKYVYDNVSVTHKSVSATEESETNVLTVDEDYAQDYGVSTLSLITEDSETLSTKTGLDSGFASVIESAKNEWMIEANGNINKIPLIIHTDQHTNFSKPLWDTISGLLDWYDVGKVINLGDTVNSYVDSDTENPLTKCENLENYISSMESVPYSKRIEIFGNHDTWMSVDETTTGLTPHNYLYKYFRNIYARRFDNYGNFVTYDDNYNVKYVVVSGFAYDSEKGGYSHYIIPSTTIDRIIEELEKADGYDVILLSHVPLKSVNFKTLSELWSGRKTKTSGSVTDEYGIAHEFDFTSCDGELLCGLHGHQHEDGCEYINDVLLSNWFDAYYISPKCIHFVLVDRENGQLNIWKVDDTPQYTNYQIPFDKPVEEATE